MTMETSTEGETLESSPYCRALLAHYGEAIPLRAAEAIARCHGVTLEGLSAIDTGKGETVPTLTLALELGY